MKKNLEIGRVDGESYGYKQRLAVTIDVELERKESSRLHESQGLALSISGYIWQPRRRDIATGGQINEEIKQALKKGALTLNKGFTRDKIINLLTIWERWHLNDLTAECGHQRPLKQYIERKDPKFFYADNYSTIILVPEFKNCPICNYTYGSKWLHEPLPKEVVNFIQSL